MESDLFGHSADWWNGAMLGALAFAALAAISVGFTTWAVIVAQKREAVAESKAFERYKVEAQSNIAAANARAEEARVKAAEAELKIIELRRTRREILAEAGNAEKFVAALSLFKDTRFDVASAPVAREQWDLLWDIEPLFIKAGWQFVDWQGGQFFAKVNNWNGLHSPRVYGVANVLNIEVEVAPDNLSRLSPAARALVDVLNSMGIETTPPGPRIVSSTSINTDAIHFLVGEKR